MGAKVSKLFRFYPSYPTVVSKLFWPTWLNDPEANPWINLPTINPLKHLQKISSITKFFIEKVAKE